MPDSVSLLKSEGHVYADFYPIWKVWVEVAIVARRVNRNLASRTMSSYIAGVAANPQSKKAARQASKMLQDYVKGLSDG